MIIEGTEVGQLSTNCYFAGDARELFVIDPGDEAQLLYDEITKSNYSVKYILLTHCHFDHCGAAQELSRLTGAPIAVYAGEAKSYTSPGVNLSATFGVTEPLPAPDILLHDGERISSGKYEFTVIHTPGHTEGSICFLCGRALFGGDTLFYMSYGRCDLPTGDFNKIKSSINKRIFPLGDNITVYPGHGRSTTIGFEKRYNELSEVSG